MSRLDRLVTIIETGSTPFIRNTAADQLSDLAKQHPEEIINLLSRVYPYLSHKKWETRITAARAFGGIVSHARQWDPNENIDNKSDTNDNDANGNNNENDNDNDNSRIKMEIDDEFNRIKKEEDNDEDDKKFLNLLDTQKYEDNLLSFQDWNLSQMLQSGRVLLASSGSEYNIFKSNEEYNQEYENQSKKRKTDFTKKLGLDEVKLEIKSEIQPKIETVKIKKEDNNSDIPHKQSARMRALAKRKAKSSRNNSNKNIQIDLSKSSVSDQLSKDGIDHINDSNNDNINDNDDNDNHKNNGNANGDNNSKKLDVEITSQANGSKLVVEHKATENSLFQEHAKYADWVWQFQGVYELLIKDLFSEVWEIRHGCAMALREIIKYQAKCAGRVKGKSKEENDIRNNKTLEDLCVRLLALFTMDRFGDYVSDTVIAPVRENAGQVMAALLLNLSEEIVLKTFDALSDLIKQDLNQLGIKMPCWEAKHGGMLGLRYFVSIRKDLLFNHPELLDRTIHLVLLCLNENGDDDVQTVAAATLIPITNEFVKLKLDLVLQIVNIIWKNLTDLKDDLSASIGSVMDLLAKLCQHDEVLDKMKEFAHLHDNYKFKYLIPRLYPFLRHSITNVRKSVLKTLLAFLSINDNDLKNWIDGKIFRLLFQNLLVEQNEDVLNLSMDVYIKLLKESNHESMDEIFKYHCIPLLSLTMTPIGIQRFNFSMNTKFILRPSGNNLTSSDISLTGYNIEENSNQENNKKKRKSIQLDTKKSNNSSTVNQIGIPDSEYDLHINIDAPMINGDVTLVGYETLIRSRLAASRAMGLTLASYKSISNLIPIFGQLNNYLNDSFSTPRLLSATIIDNFFQNYKDRPKELTDIVSGSLNKILTEPSLLPFFRESIPTLKALRTQCTQLLNSLRTNGRVSSSKIKTLAVLVAGESDAGPGAFNVNDAESLVGKYYDNCISGMSSIIKIQFQSNFEDAKYRVNQGIQEVKNAQDCRCIAVLASFADASLRVDGLPKKLNPVIRSLMDSVKTEESLLLQRRTSESVSYLVELLVQSDKMNVVDKLIKNLCGFLCVDTSEVPEFLPNKNYTDIVLSLKKEEPKTDPNEIAEHEKEIKLAIIKRRGGKLSLEKLFETFGVDLFNKLPKIFKMMLESLEIFNDENKDNSRDEIIKDVIEDIEGQSIIDSFELIRSMFKKLDISLRDIIFKKFGLIIKALKSDYSVFRYSASKCFASICNICPSDGFQILVKSIIPMLNNPINLIERQGAIETIYHITNLMGSTILPYVVFLIVPVLGRMSDSNNDVRILATTTFASIIKLVPLEAGIPDPVDMPKDLLEGRDREREFIQQMMDPSKIKSFELPISIKATLRKYQQEGVNWLYFLNKYHLHGILCDDMGLGKTLQTICIISSDHYLRNKKFTETGSIESRKLPSLIICPPSLTGHWEQEFNQYAAFMKILVYAGPPSVRTNLRNKLLKDEGNIDVIVTSYDVARNDVEYISKFDYNYCVLDEGHIIKNSNTRLTKCVKMIKANHRLILSGTPIQNNVLELWSLFDFLMPGFLGSEKNFQEKFAKPIAVSRTNKGVKEQERGALALESLHKQVLPFMLRRLKEDVLSDLPPKIIQDYYCELSNLQKQLYKDFIKKQKTSIEEDIKGEVDNTNNSNEGKQHVFQVLQYMRKLCNHPSLVLKSSHPQFKEVNEYLKKYKMNINDIEHAPKLLALKNLLKECGIGLSDNNNEIISQHRALIFCQMKDMLDIVENDLLKKHMKNVSYLRMDGSTDPRFRQDIVKKFNDDPSIDVLLLTTKVGGLGLNLTGADTVIFVEHDWNPMNDLQAMDRAHRLGQKKVVNVYRLITKNTLEEKIMGLQKFKMNIASTIVNQQNSGLASMDTHQLLDLFDGDEKNLENPDANSDANDNHSNNLTTEGDKKRQKRLEELGEVPNEAGLTGKAGSAVKDLSALWDESQYEEEYNLDTFIKTLS